MGWHRLETHRKRMGCPAFGRDGGLPQKDDVFVEFVIDKKMPTS